MVVVAKLDFKGGKKVVDIDARLFDKNGQPITTSITLPEVVLDESRMQKLDESRQLILKKVEGSWRGANIINTSDAGYLLVRLPVSSIKQWSDRLEALKQVAVIANVDVRTLEKSGGTVLLALVGSRGALKNALASHDLILVDDDDMISIVAKADTR